MDDGGDDEQFVEINLVEVVLVVVVLTVWIR